MAGATAPRFRTVQLSQKPVILVEDNEKLRRLYTDVLQSAGLTVVAASDGEKAIALLHKVISPQLIILDIMMPRMNGIETCSRIRKLQGGKACPIIFLTALDRPETLLDCLLAGGDDYLMKAAPVSEILERVQYWSRRGGLEDITERRGRAIRTLRGIVAEMSGGRPARASEEVASEQANLDLLADFLAVQAGAFAAETEMLLRFGYLVGVAEGSLSAVGGNDAGSKRFLRKLAMKTDFVDRGEIDALLEDYERTVTQNRFRVGWRRGRDDAAALGAPQQARMLARLDEA